MLKIKTIRVTPVLFAVLMALPVQADEYDRLTVGLQPDGRVIVPTNQVLKPAGRQVTFPGRPVDLALAEDGKILVVKNLRDLLFIDLATRTIRQTLPLPLKKDRKRFGFSVVGLTVTGDTIHATDAEQTVRVARRGKGGKYTWEPGITLRAPKVKEMPHGAGISSLGKSELLVAATRANNVQRIERTSGKVLEEIPVGVSPFMIQVLGTDRAYVSNWGGEPPRPGDPQAISSGTAIRIDPRTGVASSGTVSVLVRKGGKWRQARTIRVGLHPSGMSLSSGGKFLYVANANSDTVSVIDTATDQVVETIRCRPTNRLPFGSGCNALALSPDGATLYVANGTNNCVAVVRLGEKVGEGRTEGRPAASTVAGLIPVGWYPGAVLVSPDGKRLFVANIKGHGSLAQTKDRIKEKKRNSHDHLGTVSIVDIPDDARLKQYTEEVNRNNRLAYSLAGLEKARAGVKSIPVPRRHGEPSVFKHVIYVIKENRTYDQVFGDLKEGNGDQNLVMFGEKVTPNHHALARQFTLFDNFYCSGVLSADGHTWVNEAYVSDYLERSFGGFTRSYPDDGSDPLAYVPTGFLWDNALLHKKTIRNYGEYVRNSFEPKNATWTDFYQDWKNGTHRVKARAVANVRSLQPYTHSHYPWFPLLMPDVARAKLFIEELKDFEKKGTFPNLVYVTLPCDHAEGTRPDFPTPRAMTADNDLALGQIVEAVTKSKFWPETCIFVVEDDPQNGFDHVDAHRTVALVISPYTRRKFVDHTNYNQTGMVKTIELILGLPPMNQLDLSATPMRSCFQDKADLTPYRCLPNRIKLDEMNPPLNKLSGKALFWARKSLALNLDEGDAADEDTYNRILWHATRGYETPYPEKYAGKGED
jgi:YVTN family beta-propeller protein